MIETILSLWPGGQTPYAKSHSVAEYQAESWGSQSLFQVVEPSLTVYQPENPNGAAVIVIPGGGYTEVAITHEGYDVAEALAKQGFLAAVLKYRLPNPKTATHPERVPLCDLRRAMVLLKETAAKQGGKVLNLGVLGFSAGAHLAAQASVSRSESDAENPDFAILAYGISKAAVSKLTWLEHVLFHRPLTRDEKDAQNFVEQADACTPRTFLVHALDDDVCHYSESTQYAAALQDIGVQVELHLFPTGGHGFGLGDAQHGTHQWLPLACDWIVRKPAFD
jgi:acetyl esterase/lipase